MDLVRPGNNFRAIAASTHTTLPCDPTGSHKGPDHGSEGSRQETIAPVLTQDDKSLGGVCVWKPGSGLRPHRILSAKRTLINGATIFFKHYRNCLA